MPSHNRVTLLGHATRDAEMRSVGESNVASFGIACNHSWRDRKSNEWREEAMFIDVSAWGPLAERVAESVRKGQLLLVEGRLKLDAWKDRKSGDNRSKHLVIADKVLQTAPKSQDGKYESKPVRTAPTTLDQEESVPF